MSTARTALALGFALFLAAGCATAPRPPASAEPAPAISAPAPPEGADAFPRWDARLDAFARALAGIDIPLQEYESADTSLPDNPPAFGSPAFAELGDFVLNPGETLVLPPIHGPETPFPHHQPLRFIASARLFKARLALADGDEAVALRLALANLAQARATLRSQAGIIPLIHAIGVWQCALDGAHALARHPGLSPQAARVLLAELQDDARLAQTALDRALRGEYHFVYRVIVDRMPDTDDPDLALSSVASLGMAKPEPLPPGEIGLGLTEHPLLDRRATFAAYEADLAPYLASLAATSRLPRELHARHTLAKLADYSRELGAFLDYANGEAEPGLAQAARARAALESTANPVGKLLAVYLTPNWDVLFTATLRREAQRAAICGLLAWRLNGRPAPWEEIVAAGILPAPPADPFSDGPLLFDPGENARVWSVHRDGRDDGGQAVPGNTGLPADLVWLR